MRASILSLLIACAVSAFAEPRDVPLSPLRQAPLPGIHQVAVATSGTEYLIVFSRQDGFYAQRGALDGSPIDGNPQRLDVAAGAYAIRVVWTGEAYLVVWKSSRRAFSDSESRATGPCRLGSRSQTNGGTSTRSRRLAKRRSSSRARRPAIA